jgi:FtsH-binding integral membrane protein
MAQYEAARPTTFASPETAAERVSSFLRSVYAWMCGGLAVTAATAVVVAASPAIVTAIATNRLLFWGIVIAQLGIVFVLSGRVQTLASSTASILFIAYSALTGLTLSFVLLAFTGESIATTFLVTAGMFGALAAYGTFTQRSLAGWGQFLFIGLIFWQSSALQFVITFAGVIVFTGLTAYDANQLRTMALSLPEGRVASFAIVGALKLYLDFINLFLMLLRIFGDRRR